MSGWCWSQTFRGTPFGALTLAAQEADVETARLLQLAIEYDFPTARSWRGRSASCGRRCIPATRHGAAPPVSPEDQRAHLETKRFKHDLATRVGLTTKPQFDLDDVAVVGAVPRA